MLLVGSSSVDISPLLYQEFEFRFRLSILVDKRLAVGGKEGSLYSIENC
jgi:hypothetical protein